MSVFGCQTRGCTAAAARPKPIPQGTLDSQLLWLVGSLLCIGLVMTYSASISTAAASSMTGHNAEFFLIRQALFILVGVAAGAVAAATPTRVWQAAAPALLFLGLSLLVLVLVPFIGKEVYGAQRWIRLGPVNLQPSEFVKLAVLLYAADFATRKYHLMQEFVRGFLPMAAVLLIAGGLLLTEPDFGAFVVVVTIVMSVLFLGGLSWKIFASLGAVLAAGMTALVVSSPYRMERILGFMDPWADPYGKGYQLSHALIAFGRGEWFGVGLGASVEKLFYLPEAHTDFLLAVIAEELGLFGVAGVLFLFGWLVVRAFAIGHRAMQLDRHFAALTAYGIAIWIGFQAIINAGVNVGLLPTKGLTLPFMSFGGSGIVANCAAAGILLRIDWEHRAMRKGRSF